MLGFIRCTHPCCTHQRWNILPFPLVLNFERAKLRGVFRLLSETATCCLSQRVWRDSLLWYISIAAFCYLWKCPSPFFWMNFCFQWTALPGDPFQPAQLGPCWVIKVPSGSLSPSACQKHAVTLSRSSPCLPFLSKGFRFRLWGTVRRYPPGSFFSCRINMQNYWYTDK